jgi:hypothetical protein
MIQHGGRCCAGLRHHYHLGDRDLGLGQTIRAIPLISTAALVVGGIVAAVQFATRRRASRKGTLVRMRTSMAAATVAALMGGGLVVALPASGGPVTHTLHFTTEEQARNAFAGPPAGAEFEVRDWPGRGQPRLTVLDT